VPACPSEIVPAATPTGSSETGSGTLKPAKTMSTPAPSSRTAGPCVSTTSFPPGRGSI
jgi:hypothetical protein